MKVKHPLLTARFDRLIGPVLSLALAAATAFALLAMPADLMGWLLIAPPVDLATRLLVTLVGALLFGGLSFALFAWIDHAPRSRAEDDDNWDFDSDVAAPVTRGNAPPKPIFAGTELGTVAAMPAPLELAVVEPAPEEEDDALLLEMPLSRVVEDALAVPAAGGASIDTASLDELMRRLEAGIVNGAATPAAPGAADQDALRDALHELQRMAARGR